MADTTKTTAELITERLALLARLAEIDAECASRLPRKGRKASKVVRTAAQQEQDAYDSIAV